jgi:cytochrome c oxidase subunit 2
VPQPASAQARDTLHLWHGALIAALAVAALVWVLVVFVVIRYRRRSDAVPSQQPEHIPLEIAYTIVPILIVAVLFAFTVSTERRVTRLSAHPDLTVEVVGFQWQWQFHYVDEDVEVRGDSDTTPVLVLPVGETVRFKLETVDVIHSFWVPSFLGKRDMIPGIDNQIDVTLDRTGTFPGRCAEFCGLDHARMNFTVKIVSKADFDAWVAKQARS